MTNVNIDEVEDSSGFVNVFGPHRSRIMRPELQFTEFSSWIYYPERYKYFSMHFQLNQDVTHIIRRTYDVTDFGRDLGGIVFVGLRVFGIFAFIFARIRLQALVTNRLYYLSSL
jgi:hypothetical protein